MRSILHHLSQCARAQVELVPPSAEDIKSAAKFDLGCAVFSFNVQVFLQTAFYIRRRPQRMSADFPLFLTPTHLMSATVCFSSTPP